MEKTPLEYALFYAAEKGWAVFPLKPHDKKPLFPAAHEKGNPCKGECGRVGHGFHDAVTDTTIITEWWSKNPNAGIGIATGTRSGFFVLDVDPVHRGDDTLKKHIEKYGQLPKTVTALTGSGGRHYLFAMPNMDIRNSAGRLGEGLDTRGNGGYIASAPTIHPSGNPYKWLEPPSRTVLAEAPEWLLKMLFDEKISSRITTSEGVYISGQRNNALTSLAGTMRRRNMSEDAILQALTVENLNRCVPPLPDDEVKAIVLSVMRYQPQAYQPLQVRDRATAEWSFCKTIYEAPDYYLEFQDLTPDNFADEKLREYWQDVLSGMGVAQAAANAGILTDLEKYQDWSLVRLDDYAKTIRHFSRMSVFSGLGWRLQKAAELGDYEKIERTINELNSIPPTTGHTIESITELSETIEQEIRRRQEDPREVWGVPYAWNRISKLTGGKHKGELTLLAGEPKIGKSYWKLQDVWNTAIHGVGVWYWCGEMKRTQLMRRLYALYGVNSNNMKTGRMTHDDWDKLTEAKALILNSPLFIDDKSMSLHEIRPLLTRMKSEYGIQEFVIDYAKLVKAPGRDEIEQTGNISSELKAICRDLDLIGTMIASVNKQGMDNRSVVAKSNVRGSGQQIHDADVIYQITTFPEKYGADYGIMPSDYQRCIALNISAGRELETTIEGGFIPYMRELHSPRFIELNKR